MQMPSGLPARVALVCTLLFGVSIAHAERRQVAVIDLTGDPLTSKFAASFNPVLFGHPDLSPIQDATIPPQLYGEFADDDLDQIQNATNSKEAAERALASYRFEIAQESATGGQDALRRVMPGAPVVLPLYAQLTFLRAQALLGSPRQAAEASAAFALAHRLYPQFVPDAARYLPEVVEAYDAAKRRWTGKGKLEIVGHGQLWIDGKSLGKAPIEIELDAGPHVIWLTGVDRFTAGSHTMVEAGKKTKLEIDDSPTDFPTKVHRARAALRGAPDPTARAAAMRALADLVKVGDAILLSSANGKLIAQTWNAGTNDQKPGFSSLREVTKNDTPLKLLEPLAKPKAQPAPVKEEGPKPLVDKRRWYEKSPYQASMVVGVLVVIVGGYYIYKGVTDDGANLDFNPGFDTRMRW
jgi:hypothetical protein